MEEDGPASGCKSQGAYRLSSGGDVVEGIRASGRGYNARVERVLRDALEKGEL